MTIKLYNVPITFIVRAESQLDALRVADEELGYLCGLDDSPAIGYEMPTDENAHKVTEEDNYAEEDDDAA
jgi:hypothetical protein